MTNDNRLTYIDEEGNEVLCEILFTFESEEFKKNYVLFYPIGSEEDDEIEVMAASYIPNGDGVGELQNIETEEEWMLIEDVLAQFEEDEDFYDEDFDDEDYDDDDYDDEEDEECHDCGCGHKH